MKGEKSLRYEIVITSKFFIPGRPKKRDPVVIVRDPREAYLIWLRLNGRSRLEDLYAINVK